MSVYSISSQNHRGTHYTHVHSIIHSQCIMSIKRIGKSPVYYSVLLKEATCHACQLRAETGIYGIPRWEISGVTLNSLIGLYLGLYQGRCSFDGAIDCCVYLPAGSDSNCAINILNLVLSSALCTILTSFSVT